MARRLACGHASALEASSRTRVLVAATGLLEAASDAVQCDKYHKNGQQVLDTSEPQVHCSIPIDTMHVHAVCVAPHVCMHTFLNSNLAAAATAAAAVAHQGTQLGIAMHGLHVHTVMLTLCADVVPWQAHVGV